MTATLIHAFGTGRRKPYVSAEAEGRKADRIAKEKADARRPSARFTVTELTRFQKAAVKLVIKGDPDAIRADRLLCKTIRNSQSGFVNLAPEAQDAAFLARFLRRRELNGFCVGLARLDEIAGATPPAGRAIEITPDSLVEALGRLEAVEGEGADRAAAAAAHLRTATINPRTAFASVSLAPEDRRLVADALHAVGTSRITVSKFDNGNGFRPRLAPAP
ncbi:hypothetical protein [Methylobacterium sp. WL19]|uniref:hypothetical protein n=1 Tax=Methylobacterium sp. WL19 TaxID=2603896 RepID=UPI0011C7B170|nr:hypothetical protein [Methylobacterium sp. WL19]TXN26870.1 hypothetical protein FV220_13605 [Methylobacterium sp. WL19]